MKIPVLMVSTASQWLGTARMPRALSKAGFDVFLLAPENSLASKSRFVTRTWFLPESALPMEWLLALNAAIEATSPSLLVPCDEMTIRLLFAFMLEPLPVLGKTKHARLAALIRESLGDPAHYQTSIDKTLLPVAAESLGIRVPPFTVVRDVRSAQAFAQRLGFPVVLKRRFGFAGHGVAIVSTPDDLVQRAYDLLRPDQLDLGNHLEPRLLVQAFIVGRHLSQALVSLRGVSLASFAWERYQSTEDVAGQTSVVRFIESQETRESAEALSCAFGMEGFFNVQYIVRNDTREAYLLEINRRIVTHMHMGERVDADLPRALHRHLSGLRDRSGTTGSGVNAIGAMVTVFPREYLRDPQSPYLRECPVDAPWDDPDLFAAMLAQ